MSKKAELPLGLVEIEMWLKTSLILSKLIKSIEIMPLEEVYLMHCLTQNCNIHNHINWGLTLHATHALTNGERMLKIIA